MEKVFVDVELSKFIYVFTVKPVLSSHPWEA